MMKKNTASFIITLYQKIVCLKVENFQQSFPWNDGECAPY